MNKYIIKIHKDFLEKVFPNSNFNLFNSINQYLGNYRIEGEDIYSNRYLLVSFLSNELLIDGQDNICDVICVEKGGSIFITGIVHIATGKVFERLDK